MGRPRSEQAHVRVLEAGAGLFADQGIDATSMDAIAEASGVSKAIDLQALAGQGRSV
jgi:AcrR family transcriptional regulator